ncbi:transporter, partial [Fischerella thermalis CCMEE 5318]
MTKVLFISPYGEDYLADGLLHGLRSLLKENVVDFPKCAHLYKNYVQESKVKLYGNGFTLYGLLEDIPVDRTEIDFKIRNGFFDLIIFPAIFKNFGLFIEFLPYLNFRNTAIIDGDDTPQPYGYAGKWWREPKWWFLPKAHQQFLYFKREWTLETIRHFWFKLPPVFIC